MPDGWEVDNGFDPTINDAGLDNDSDGLNNTEELELNNLGINVDPNKNDTDDDGLLDGEEVKNYGTDPTSKYSDNDNLTDYEEVIIYDTNPLSEHSDLDNLNDTEEIFIYFTDPNDADIDGDGLLDHQEVENRTSPFSNDTDGDGLEDLDEIENHGTDPTNPDTDNDTISDKQEIDGWEIVIGYYDGKKGDDEGEVVMEEHTFTSDPTVHLKDDTIYEGFKPRSGNDIDQDHIPDDIERSMIAPFQNITPENLSEEQNNTKAQYNPFIKEKTPPKLSNLRVERHVKKGTNWLGIKYVKHCYTTVKVDVKDAVKIYYVWIRVLDNNKGKRIWGHGDGEYTTKLDIDYGSHYLFSFEVEVTAEDTNENVIKIKKEKKSDWWAVVTFIGDLILDVLKWIVEKIGEIINGIIEWIKNSITSALNSLIQPLSDSILSLINQMIDELEVDYQDAKEAHDAGLGFASDSGQSFFNFFT